MDDLKFYTLKQVCEILQITRPTALNLIKTGRLEVYRTGGDRGSYRITPAQIKKCIDNTKK